MRLREVTMGVRKGTIGGKGRGDKGKERDDE